MITALAVVPAVFYAYSAYNDRRCAKPEGRVFAPAMDASAEEAVRGYLNAVQANDQATERELSTPEFFELQQELADNSFCTWKEVRIWRLSPLVPDRYEPGGYSQAVRVWVEFGREVAKGQGVQGGDEPWSYLLVRNADSERWRVAAKDGKGTIDPCPPGDHVRRLQCAAGARTSPSATSYAVSASILDRCDRMVICHQTHRFGCGGRHALR